MTARKSSPPTPIEDDSPTLIKNESLTPAEALRQQCVAMLAQAPLTDAVREARDALQRRANIEAAIVRSRDQRAAAAQRIAELNSVLPTLEAQLALAIANSVGDTALEDEVERLQANIDEGTLERSDKQLEVGRCERTLAVLEREIVGADEEIAAARLHVDAALSVLRGELMPAVDEAVAAAAAPLAEVKAVLRGLLVALPGLPLRDDVAAIHLTMPSAASVDLSGLQQQALGDDLLSMLDPVDVTVPDGITDTINRLKSHRAYSVNKPSIFEQALRAPYVPKSASPEKIAEWAREEQERPAQAFSSNPPGRSWSVREAKPCARQREGTGLSKEGQSGS